MSFVIKILLIIVLFIIFYQDNKEQLVDVYLYFLVAILGGLLHYFNNSTFQVMLIEIAINSIVVSLILIISYFVSKIFLKKKFLNHSFGIGDLFLFFALCFLFPSKTFILFFVFSLFFSLLVHLFLNKKNTTVPLAGYMSLFFGFVYIFQTIFNFNIYTFL